jgi:assimilatory nitrate reductase catalytic subunit
LLPEKDVNPTSERVAATHCPYCALQCGMHVALERDGVRVLANARFPVNQGGMCVKGWTAAETIGHAQRLRAPLVRNALGELVTASWDAALDLIGEKCQAVQAAHGRNAVGVFGGGSLTNEKAYLLGKFARVALGTANIDYNGRFCMSSAAAAAIKAFGIDRGLPFPLADIPGAKTILLVGSNVAETMPPVMRYFEEQQRAGGRLILVDPRRSATAQWAALHLRVRPGGDAALANGLLHILIREHLIDEAYIAERTTEFGGARQIAAAYWPERVERLTGIAEAQLIEAARMLGEAGNSAMILTARGSEQHASGVNNTLAYINLALALGSVGRPSGGFGTITGQGNGQGGREHGQKADQLPGYRRIDDPAARAHVAAVWGIDELSLPGAGKSAYELLTSIGDADGIRALFVMGSNIVVSAPDATRVIERLEALEFLVVSDFFLGETAQLADVVLPSAQWAEEEGTTTNLEGRVLHRVRALAPPPGVRDDIEVLSALAARLGHAGRFSYTGSRDVFDELRRASHGGPADYAGITYDRIDAEDGVFWPCPTLDHPGTMRLFANGFPTATGRARFHETPHVPPAEDRDAEYPLLLTTGRVLAQYQSGAQTRRVAQLNDLAPEPFAEMHPAAAKRAQVAEGEHVRLETRRGAATFRVKISRAIREDTVFVPFHWGGEQSVNLLTNTALDPTSRMPEFKACAVRASAGRAESGS